MISTSEFLADHRDTVSGETHRRKESGVSLSSFWSMGSSATGKDGVHVQVLLRCRPATKDEQRSSHVVQCHEARKEVTVTQTVAGRALDKRYTFDRVFGPNATQEAVFRSAVIPIIDEVLEGFNCTIFAYGQTGTGKTFTMEGGAGKYLVQGGKLSSSAGVIPRAINRIFEVLKSNDSDHNVQVSFLELYNEELTDLWGIQEETKTQRLKLMEDKYGGVVVNGLEECIVENAAQIQEILERGSSKRKTAETMLNKQSSRSHSIFSVTIRMKDVNKDGEDVFKTGKLNLVDLAGSEDISRSGANQERAREAGSINQSLLTLGRVINALVNNSSHIPYRDSKLTRLLRDSLGGKTKTCIIATVAPTVQCQEETISTLDYAHRAKNIRNKPEVNQRISRTGYIKELHMQIQRLNQELGQQRLKDGGVYVGAEQYEQMVAELGTVKQEVKNLAAGNGSKDAEIENLVAQQEEREQEIGALKHQLDVKTFVCTFHEKAERSLANHSINLSRQLGKLDEAFQSATQLLDASASQDADNKSLAEGIKSMVPQQIEGLGESVKQLVQVGLEGNQEIEKEMTLFQERRAQESADALAGAARISRMAEDVKGSYDKALDRLTHEASDRAKRVGEYSMACLLEAKQEVESSIGRIATVEASLVTATKGIKANVDSFLTQQVASTEKVIQSNKSIQEKAVGMKRKAMEDISGLKRDEEESIDVLMRHVDDFKQQMTKYTLEKVDKLNQEIVAFKKRKIETCEEYAVQMEASGDIIDTLLTDQQGDLESMRESTQTKAAGLEEDFKEVPMVVADLQECAQEARTHCSRLEKNHQGVFPTTEALKENVSKVAQEGREEGHESIEALGNASGAIAKKIREGLEVDGLLARRVQLVAQMASEQLEAKRQSLTEGHISLQSYAQDKVDAMQWRNHRGQLPETDEVLPSIDIVDRLRAPPNIEDLYTSNAQEVLQPKQVINVSKNSAQLAGNQEGEMDSTQTSSKAPASASRIPKSMKESSNPVKPHRSDDDSLQNRLVEENGSNRNRKPFSAR
ncbi:hypothetical protein BSKO_01207 [Bryopsis sp. KO-2023]|nr:hypothetical protein BSKO_01207 [Bryopsis sp. KO-2023]